MTSSIMLLSAVLTLVADPTGPQTERTKRELDAVSAFLREHQATDGVVQVKSEAVLAEVFPQHAFVAVRFRQFPVARALPKGFTASNILAVSKETKVSHLKEIKDLQTFFRENAAEARTAGTLKQLLAAWLTLAQEHYQDGFYKFEVLEKDFTVNKERTQIRGRAVVMQGGNGEVTATLDFEDGKLTKVAEKAALRPGPRPICQATRLLDPDPLVRRIAEQDLLIMGIAAREYLQEQRVAAGPELQRALDDLWQRIEKNGW